MLTTMEFDAWRQPCFDLHPSLLHKQAIVVLPGVTVAVREVDDRLEGERLLADDGSSRQGVPVSLRPETELVYNIEVEGEPCYKVGQ